MAKKGGFLLGAVVGGTAASNRRIIVSTQIW